MFISFLSNYDLLSPLSLTFHSHSKEMETRERDWGGFCFSFAPISLPSPSLSLFPVLLLLLLLLTWNGSPGKCVQRWLKRIAPPPLAPFKGSLEIGFLWLPIKRDCRARPTKVEAEVGPRVERSNSCHSTSIQRPFSLVYFSMCLDAARWCCPLR